MKKDQNSLTVIIVAVPSQLNICLAILIHILKCICNIVRELYVNYKHVYVHQINIS